MSALYPPYFLGSKHSKVKREVATDLADVARDDEALVGDDQLALEEPGGAAALGEGAVIHRGGGSETCSLI
jgi:hypothetical protein